jgi:hypothetical protein
MADEIASIDVSCIDALKQLKDEQDVLDQRIKAMDDMKSSVAEAVYLRVRADYAAKRGVLEEKSQPLRDKARGEYARLLAILGELEAAHETVKLDQQEIELRHTLGEFDKKEYEQRTKAIAAVAAEKGAAHEQARALRERFLGSVRDEDDLRTGLPAAPAPAAPVAAAPHTTAEIALPPEARADITAEIARPVAGRADFTAEIPQPPPVGSTIVMPAVPGLRTPAAPPPPVDGTPGVPGPGLAAPPPPARPAPAVGNDATVMFRPARLVPQNPEAGKATHALTLKPVNIGSDAGNEIRVGGPGVEPRHAQILPTPKGYSLVDLDTRHGTRVNAEKVRERVLANEDVVQVGAARFVFRTS